MLKDYENFVLFIIVVVNDSKQFYFVVGNCSLYFRKIVGFDLNICRLYVWLVI